MAELTNEEALLKSEEILEKIKAGEDIAALVEEFTEDTASIPDGGQYTFPRGRMVEPFETWSFDPARVAGDTGIVETHYGYHIMLFEKRTGGSFEDIDTAPLIERLQSEMFREKFAASYETISSEGWAVSKDAITQIIWGIGQ
jgi:foldase protein PrsA